MKCRLPWKAAAWAVVPVLVAGLIVSLVWMHDPACRQVAEDGRLVFSAKRPPLSKDDGGFAIGAQRPMTSWKLAGWFHARFEDLMSWDLNPWRRQRRSFGAHFWDLCKSDDPADQAMAAELRERAQEWYRQMLERYPEFAIELRDVPPEQNGFLKMLELAERLEAEGTGSFQPDLPLSPTLRDHFDDGGKWNPAEARQWLAEHADLMEEIRAIGLLPDQSVTGIDLARWFVISSKVYRSAAQALLAEAHLAADEGRTADAMQSVQAARGLAHHLGDIESPTLLNETVNILLIRTVAGYTMDQILPALPAGEIDPVTWEQVVDPPVSPPSHFAELMKAEWRISSQALLLPMLADTTDPYYPPDVADLLDTHALLNLRLAERFSSDKVSDWAQLGDTSNGEPDLSHLSSTSREAVGTFFIGANAWCRGLRRAVAEDAMQRAAYSLMKGEPVPYDPFFGQPYRWNPETRELRAPDTPEFSEFDLRPIVVPRP
ncbi:hypothetical protein [Haloferula sargassicola]|uniref:Cytochrome P450 n=1 Tax=Haloferula sargassicola TaxID=490096 RepID=A0ABP9UJN1_9BACT